MLLEQSWKNLGSNISSVAFWPTTLQISPKLAAQTFWMWNILQSQHILQNLGRVRCSVMLFPTMGAIFHVTATASVFTSSLLSRSVSSMRTRHTLVSTSNRSINSWSNRASKAAWLVFLTWLFWPARYLNTIGSIWKKHMGSKAGFLDKIMQYEALLSQFVLDH